MPNRLFESVAAAEAHNARVRRGYRERQGLDVAPADDKARECAIADAYDFAPVDADPHLKFRNRPTGGYASVKESRRAAELKLLEKSGQISNLQEQVKYLLVPKQDGERAVFYWADFVYERSGETVVEDVKSAATKTPVYVLKRKLMLMVHSIRIREI